jgi:hypothetical protein
MIPLFEAADPKTVRVCLVTPDGEEVTTEYFPAGIPDDQIYASIEDILGKVHSPFAGIRAYRGSHLIHKRTTRSTSQLSARCWSQYTPASPAIAMSAVTASSHVFARFP